MASEISQLLYQYLEQLPTSHVDRRFLEGIQESVAAYVEQTTAVPSAEPTAASEAEHIPKAIVAAVEPMATVVTTDLAERAMSAEQERIRLDGRIGAAVAFRKTPKGMHIARFPLAVREDTDSTVWHTVLAFNKLADKLWDQRPAKGSVATVIGYKHPREVTGRDGTTKTVDDIYAVAVKVR